MLEGDEERGSAEVLVAKEYAVTLIGISPQTISRRRNAGS
jgi:hypothetical protein